MNKWIGEFDEFLSGIGDFFQLGGVYMRVFEHVDDYKDADKNVGVSGERRDSTHSID